MNDYLVLWGSLAVASVVVCLPLSVVRMFKKETMLGQKIAIGVSVLALLIIAFLPIEEFLFIKFSGIEYIKSFFDNVNNISFELSELFPILCALFFASSISMFVSSFYIKGGIIGGVLMLIAVLWLLYEISSLQIVKIGIGTYLYGLCAIINCFTPLFNKIG